ncbi:MAG TPA: hypothetical protein VFI00_13815 [Kribbella sp.]|nr:hypothetical protein [Kribbella sp.]
MASLGLSGGAAAPPGGALGLAEAAVRRLRVELSVDEAHDRVELVLWAGSKLAGAAPGDVLSVALGNGQGDPEDIMRAEVNGVDAIAGGSVLTAFSASRRLSLTHSGRSWRQTTLAQVVRDLLGDGEVDAGDVDATLSLPALHVDPHRSIWSALHDLARRTGHQITSTADGKVSFTPAAGAGAVGGLAAVGGLGSGELREGAELLTFRAGPRQARTALTRVSPAGAQYWYLLEAAPDSGSEVEVVDPALRTREAANAGTDAFAADASRATRRARMRVTGRPGLRAGTTIQARGESYRVLRVRHAVDPATGYLCDVLLEGDS